MIIPSWSFHCSVIFVYAFKLHHELSKLSFFFPLCLITNKPPNIIFPTNSSGYDYNDRHISPSTLECNKMSQETHDSNQISLFSRRCGMV